MKPFQAEATPGLLTQGDCRIAGEALIIKRRVLAGLK